MLLSFYLFVLRSFMEQTAKYARSLYYIIKYTHNCL